MNINEAMRLLEKSSITSSKQMLRRWIRQGKIDAVLQSKKEGYEIDAASLDSFIQDKVAKATSAPPNGRNPIDYQEGYNDGYNAALLDVSKRFKKMAFLGMYEKNFPINRSEFRDLCFRKISRNMVQAFLAFTDREFFGKQVSKPRNKIWCNLIGNYMYFELVGLLIDQTQYEYDLELDQEYNAYEMLIQNLYEKFRKEDKVTGNK